MYFPSCKFLVIGRLLNLMALSIYIGEAPEYGKATFQQRLEREIGRIKKRYPSAIYRNYSAPCKNPRIQAHYRV